jgi:hypothetical protein
MMKVSNLHLITGLAVLPAILLQDNLVGIGFQTIYVIILAISHGRKFRILPNLILLISVSAAHLLQPNGLHLFSIGTFPITLGALLLGARKACTLIALLYLSHYMASGKPKFPGRLGSLISLQFTYFDAITTDWHAIYPKRPFIAAIDKLLFGLSVQDTSVTVQTTVKTASLRAILYSTVHMVVLWSLFVLGTLEVLPTVI